MILVPQRLFTADTVRVLARDGNHCALHKRLPQAQVAKEAYVANHVVSLVLNGRQVIRTYEGSVVSASAGEALFLPRGVYYITDLLPGGGGPFESLLFYFGDDAIHRFLADTDVTEVNRDEAPDHLKLTAGPGVAAFVRGCLGMSHAAPLTKPLLHLKTSELLHLLHARVGGQALVRFLFRLTLPRRRNLREFMEANVAKPLSVVDYAYLTGRSVSSFRRDFRAYFGTTPNKWLRYQRMQQAVGLLAAGEMSVAELAYAVGYDNVSYFIREFRKVTGQSPKQYMLTRRDDGRPPIEA